MLSFISVTKSPPYSLATQVLRPRSSFSPSKRPEPLLEAQHFSPFAKDSAIPFLCALLRMYFLLQRCLSRQSSSQGKDVCWHQAQVSSSLRGPFWFLLFLLLPLPLSPPFLDHCILLGQDVLEDCCYLYYFLQQQCKLCAWSRFVRRMTRAQHRATHTETLSRWTCINKQPTPRWLYGPGSHCLALLGQPPSFLTAHISFTADVPSDGLFKPASYH